MHVRHRGRKIKEKKMKYLQKLQLAKMSEMITIKPQGTSTSTICNDNLKDNQYNESELESTKKEILVNASNNPHLYNSSLKEEEYKDVNMKGNSWEETVSTANMSIASCQNQLVSLSESGKEQPLQKTEIQSGDGITHQAASPLCNDVLLTNPIKRIETYVNMTNPTVKEQLMDISSVACNNTNMDTNNIPSTHQIISGTVPENSFSNGSSSISSDNLKANNAHQIEDPTGPNKQPPLLQLPPSCGYRSSSHMIQTTSSVSTPFPSMTQTTSSVISESAPFSMTHTTSSVSSVVAPFPSLTQTISSVSPLSSPFLILKSPDNMKTDSSIKIKKEACSLATLNTLQNCVAKQFSQQSICKPFDLDYSPSEKMFLLLVGAELEKMPEPEKLKRKLAIMDILWKPL